VSVKNKAHQQIGVVYFSSTLTIRLSGFEAKKQAVLGQNANPRIVTKIELVPFLQFCVWQPMQLCSAILQELKSKK
jgi:hypothetical protein